MLSLIHVCGNFLQVSDQWFDMRVDVPGRAVRLFFKGRLFFLSKQQPMSLFRL